MIVAILKKIDNFRFGELRKSEFVMVDNMEWFNVFRFHFYCSHYDTQCCICD